jgi:hypothetical protein
LVVFFLIKEIVLQKRRGSDVKSILGVVSEATRHGSFEIIGFDQTAQEKSDRLYNGGLQQSSCLGYIFSYLLALCRLCIDARTIP